MSPQCQNLNYMVQVLHSKCCLPPAGSGVDAVANRVCGGGKIVAVECTVEAGGGGDGGGNGGGGADDGNLAWCQDGLVSNMQLTIGHPTSEQPLALLLDLASTSTFASAQAESQVQRPMRLPLQD